MRIYFDQESSSPCPHTLHNEGVPTQPVTSERRDALSLASLPFASASWWAWVSFGGSVGAGVGGWVGGWVG